MGLIKEPKNVDFSMRSEPWTDEELLEFREFLKGFKASTVKKSSPKRRTSAKGKISEKN